jgi:hypothetical protein
MSFRIPRHAQTLHSYMHYENHGATEVRSSAGGAGLSDLVDGICAQEVILCSITVQLDALQQQVEH